MGILSGLGSFDPERHRLTLDFKTVDRGSAHSDEGLIPDDLAQALKGYVESATTEQKRALEEAASKSPVSKKRIAVIKKCIKEQSPEKYKKIRNVFVAYAQSTKPTARSLKNLSQRADPRAALSNLPDFPGLASVSAPDPKKATSIQQIVKEINLAWGSELKAIEGMGLEEIKEAMPVLVSSLISKKEPFSENSIHRVASFIRKHPDLVAEIDPALKVHFTNISDVLKGGTFARAGEFSSGGVYMGSYKGQARIVVKPRKEEYLTPYNPNKHLGNPTGGPPIKAKGPLGSPIRRGHFSGDSALRERDAYVTDYQEGSFSKTPPTLLVAMYRRGPMMPEDETLKVCSVQAFVRGQTPKKADLPTLDQASLEAIAYADVDEGNSDRHLSGNLFMLPDGSVQRIDQGMTRGITPDECKFGWVRLPQMARSMTAATREKIANQNLSLRLMSLESLGLPKEAIELERARILLKKEAAEAGLTFFDIGAIILPSPGTGGSVICEFKRLLERARGPSSSIEGEIKKLVESVAGWKKSISAMYHAKDGVGIAKHTQSLRAHHPYLVHILNKHIQLLEGKS